MAVSRPSFQRSLPAALRIESALATVARRDRALLCRGSRRAHCSVRSRSVLDDAARRRLDGALTKVTPPARRMT